MLAFFQFLTFTLNPSFLDLQVFSFVHALTRGVNPTRWFLSICILMTFFNHFNCLLKKD